jgi:hypothetical protein
MVIGDSYVWAHFPKAAGDATLGLFRMFPRTIVRSDDITSPEKHTRFPAVEDELAGRALVMNIRPLPGWVLSFAHHMWKQSGRGRDPETMREIIREVEPDGKLRGFCGDGRFTVDHWIRTEHLADDFLEFMATVTDVSPRARQRVLSAQRAQRTQRANVQRYDHDWSAWFTPEDIERLYEENPFWTSIERGAAERA